MLKKRLHKDTSFSEILWGSISRLIEKGLFKRGKTIFK